MGKNLKSQFFYAINQCKALGSDKHSLKKYGNDNSKIVSYASLTARKDIAKNFSFFMREKFPEIKKASDINQRHVQAFLMDKAKVCSDDTIKTYMSQIKALVNNINKVFLEAEINIDTLPKIEGYRKKIRNDMMDPEYLELLKSYAKTLKNNTLYNALIISEVSGLRVAEIAKLQRRDVIFQEGIAYVNVVDGKGKRDRTVIVSNPEHVKNLQAIYLRLDEPTQRFCPVQSESLIKALARALGKLGLKKFYENQGFHSIRKLFAEREYNWCVKNGKSEKEAREYVIIQLGHSKDRGNDMLLFSRYVQGRLVS